MARVGSNQDHVDHKLGALTSRLRCQPLDYAAILHKLFSLHIPQYLIPTLIPIKCFFFYIV